MGIYSKITISHWSSPTVATGWEWESLWSELQKLDADVVYCIINADLMEDNKSILQVNVTITCGHNTVMPFKQKFNLPSTEHPNHTGMLLRKGISYQLREFIIAQIKPLQLSQFMHWPVTD